MARNGSGVYSPPSPLNPVVSGTVITTTWANTTITDIATALTQSIASTGVTTPVANLPMGGFRHTGVGNANSGSCYASVDDIQEGSLVTLAAVAGTDTITATAPFTLAGYVGGQAFRFLAAATNTGPVTINIDGLGAKAITKQGASALAAADITIGQVVEIVYDGTQFQFSNSGQSGGSFYTGSTTRNLVTASGTQAITGVGFRPKAVFLIAGVSGTNAFSAGFDNAVNSSSGYNQIAGGGLWSVSTPGSVSLITGLSDQQVASVSSMDIDGFTLNWSKTGSPTGIATVTFLAMR